MTDNNFDKDFKKSIRYTIENDLAQKRISILPPPYKRKVTLTEGEVRGLIDRLQDCIRE